LCKLDPAFCPFDLALDEGFGHLALGDVAQRSAASRISSWSVWVLAGGIFGDDYATLAYAI
jgi:hypothetical protein